MHEVADIAGLIVTLAIIATVLGSKETKGDINSLGKLFTESLHVAKQG